MPGFNVGASPEARLLFAASTVIACCVAAVLFAVLANFLNAARSGEVERQRKSPVETGTMLTYMVAYYLLVKSRAGTVAVPGFGLLCALTGIGLGLVAAGAAVNILGRLRLGTNWANQVTVYEAQTLVTTGVYGLVRHPLYASLIAMFIGVALAYHNAAALAATLLVFVPAMRYRASQEEALLADRFPEYSAYQRRVGRLFPRLGGKRDDDV